MDIQVTIDFCRLDSDHLPSGCRNIESTDSGMNGFEKTFKNSWICDMKMLGIQTKHQQNVTIRKQSIVNSLFYWLRVYIWKFNVGLYDCFQIIFFQMVV